MIIVSIVIVLLVVGLRQVRSYSAISIARERFTHNTLFRKDGISGMGLCSDLLIVVGKIIDVVGKYVLQGDNNNLSAGYV